MSKVCKNVQVPTYSVYWTYVTYNMETLPQEDNANLVRRCAVRNFSVCNICLEKALCEGPDVAV